MKHWIVPAVLAIALIFTGVWGYQQYQLNQEYMRHMENIYQKSFYELVGNVGSVGAAGQTNGQRRPEPACNLFV